MADKAAGCYGTGGGGVVVCCVRGGGEVSGNPAGDAQAGGWVVLLAMLALLLKYRVGQGASSTPHPAVA